MLRRLFPALAAMAAFIVACASGNRATPGTSPATARLASGSRCGERLDSMFLRNGPVYRGCEVDDSARLISHQPRPDYRYSPNDRCLRADIDVLVGANGVPDADVMKIARTNNEAFAHAVMDEVPTLRYRAAVKAGQPVAQVVRVSVMVSSVVVRRAAGSPPTPPPEGSMPRC